VTVKDVLMSLKFRGDTLYGFGSNGLVPLELWQRRIVRLREPLVVETRAAFVAAVCPTSPLRQVGVALSAASRIGSLSHQRACCYVHSEAGERLTCRYTPYGCMVAAKWAVLA
jgi:hypothetical protein